MCVCVWPPPRPPRQSERLLSSRSLVAWQLFLMGSWSLATNPVLVPWGVAVSMQQQMASIGGLALGFMCLKVRFLVTLSLCQSIVWISCAMSMSDPDTALRLEARGRRAHRDARRQRHENDDGGDRRRTASMHHRRPRRWSRRRWDEAKATSRRPRGGLAALCGAPQGLTELRGGLARRLAVSRGASRRLAAPRGISRRLAAPREGLAEA